MRVPCNARLQEHIRFLEEHVVALNAELARPICTEDERNRLQLGIVVAEQALACYKNGVRTRAENRLKFLFCGDFERKAKIPASVQLMHTRC